MRLPGKQVRQFGIHSYSRTIYSQLLLLDRVLSHNYGRNSLTSTEIMTNKANSNNIHFEIMKNRIVVTS